jgi:hypothetical protein
MDRLDRFVCESNLEHHFTVPLSRRSTDQPDPYRKPLNSASFVRDTTASPIAKRGTQRGRTRFCILFLPIESSSLDIMGM